MGKSKATEIKEHTLEKIKVDGFEAERKIPREELEASELGAFTGFHNLGRCRRIGIGCLTCRETCELYDGSPIDNFLIYFREVF